MDGGEGTLEFRIGDGQTSLTHYLDDVSVVERPSEDSWDELEPTATPVPTPAPTPLADNGAAIIINDSELCAENLSSAVINLVNNFDTLKSMSAKAAAMGRRDAVDNILAIAEEILIKGAIG